MSCPTCGGTTREAIAPGYYRCESLVAYTAYVMGPAPGTPPHLGIQQPMPVTQTRVCGVEYQEGAPSVSETLCACGTFAIGRCAECGTPVCGTHSALRGERRLCREHVAVVDTAEVEAKAAAAAAETRRQRAATDASTLHRLRGITDVDDRFFVTYLIATWGLKGTSLPDEPERRALFSPVAPQFFRAPGDDPAQWTWDDEAVLRWLVSRHVGRSRPIQVRTNRKGLLGGVRTVTVGRWSGWPVGTRYYEGTYRSAGTTATIYLLETGDTVEVSDPKGRSSPWVAQGRISISHALALAQAVGLPMVPEK